MGVGMTIQGASPPSPLRMERGVNSTICKQRGRFFDVKRRPFHSKETPSSYQRNAFFVLKGIIPLIKDNATLQGQVPSAGNPSTSINQ